MALTAPCTAPVWLRSHGQSMRDPSICALEVFISEFSFYAKDRPRNPGTQPCSLGRADPQTQTNPLVLGISSGQAQGMALLIGRSVINGNLILAMNRARPASPVLALWTLAAVG